METEVDFDTSRLLEEKKQFFELKRIEQQIAKCRLEGWTDTLYQLIIEQAIIQDQMCN
tara:strand:+ start:1220 stop:1393 length:174 start_codon:yes stop_codon:yes gene_type:complete